MNNRKPSRNVLTVAGMTLPCLVLATAAYAQAQTETPLRGQSAGTNALETIVVTAQKRSESLQETPIAVSAITGQEIEARAVTGLLSLNAVAPSLTVIGTNAGPTNATIFIRGIGNQEPILTADYPVAVYVDGIILGRSSGAAFEIVDLERVEVLRGPQGTLYGRNTIGGAINLITRKPADEFGIAQKLSLGNYGYWQSRTRLDTGELGSSGLHASLSYLHKERDGVVDNALNSSDSHDPGASTIDAARAALSYDRGGAFRASYAFDFNRSKAIPLAPQLTTVSPALATFFANSPAAGGGTLTVSPSRLDTLNLDDLAFITDKVWGHTLTLEADVGGATLRSLTGYRRWTQDVPNSELDGVANLRGPILGQGSTPQPITLFSGSASRRQHQVSQELNLIGRIGNAVEYIIGGYYFREKGEETNPQRFAAITPGGALLLASLLQYETESSSHALFAQGTWHATDRWSLTGGARYTWDEKSLDQTGPANLIRSLDRDFSKFNWALTADYAFRDGIMGYGRIATGYKAGGFTARSAPPFDAEELTSYEIGLKTEILDRRLRFNTSVYYTDHKDLQVQQFQGGSGGAVQITTNAGKAHYQGIELEVNAVPFTGLTTYVNVGYIDRKYDEFIVLDPVTDQFFDIADRAKFVFSADTTVNAGVQYQFPAFDFGVFAARLDYGYTSGRIFNPSELGAPNYRAIAAEPRGLLDARLTLSEFELMGADASIALWGRNITDKEYRMVGIDFGGLGFATNTYGEPATWGVDFNIEF